MKRKYVLVFSHLLLSMQPIKLSSSWAPLAAEGKQCLFIYVCWAGNIFNRFLMQLEFSISVINWLHTNYTAHNTTPTATVRSCNWSNCCWTLERIFNFKKQDQRYYPNGFKCFQMLQCISRNKTKKSIIPMVSNVAKCYSVYFNKRLMLRSREGKNALFITL